MAYTTKRMPKASLLGILGWGRVYSKEQPIKLRRENTNQINVRSMLGYKFTVFGSIQFFFWNVIRKMCKKGFDCSILINVLLLLSQCCFSYIDNSRSTKKSSFCDMIWNGRLTLIEMFSITHFRKKMYVERYR